MHSARRPNSPSSRLAASGRALAAILGFRGILDDRPIWIPLVILVLPGAIFSSFIGSHGIPSLRHDWDWPSSRDVTINYLTNSLSGWVPDGIGQAHAVTNGYIVACLVGALSLLVGPYATLLVFAGAIGILGSIAASRIVSAFSNSMILAGIAAMFFLFNAWTYSEVVAGHMNMILSCAALAIIVAEVIHQDKAPATATLAAALVTVQLQFALIAGPLLLWLAVRRRCWGPLIALLAAGAPAILGVLLNLNPLSATPFTLTWEQSQSIPPASAFFLDGFFAGYTKPLTPYILAGMIPVIASAIFALWSARLHWRRISFGVALIAIPAVYAMGTRGPLSGVEVWLVTHVTASGVFRELYDLLGLSCIGYVVLGAISSSASSRSATLFGIGAFILSAAWLWYPPSSYWVNAGVIPHPDFRCLPNTRFALIPALQPMRLKDRFGSGTDPDSFAHQGNCTPINLYLPQFPVGSALAQYILTRDTSKLQALGVSVIVTRPWLRSDSLSLRYQLNTDASVAHVSPRHASITLLSPVPELSYVIGLPQLSTLNLTPGDGSIFFGDAAVVSGRDVSPDWRKNAPPLVVKATGRGLDPADGWVSASFVFLEHPDLAQGIGGAVTTSPRYALPLPAGHNILANIRGSLLTDSGRLISRSTRGYEWIAEGGAVSAVRCRGLCVVAAVGSEPQLAQVTTLAAPHQLALKQILPWIAITRVPAHPAGTMRYNVRFDPHWMAFIGRRLMTHVRLDLVMNGWLLPRCSTSSFVLLVNVAALLQAVLELLALIVVSALLAVELRRSKPG